MPKIEIPKLKLIDNPSIYKLLDEAFIDPADIDTVESEQEPIKKTQSNRDSFIKNVFKNQIFSSITPIISWNKAVDPKGYMMEVNDVQDLLERDTSTLRDSLISSNYDSILVGEYIANSNTENKPNGRILIYVSDDKSNVNMIDIILMIQTEVYNALIAKPLGIVEIPIEKEALNYLILPNAYISKNSENVGAMKTAISAVDEQQTLFTKQGLDLHSLKTDPDKLQSLEAALVSKEVKPTFTKDLAAEITSMINGSGLINNFNLPVPTVISMMSLVAYHKILKSSTRESKRESTYKTIVLDTLANYMKSYNKNRDKFNARVPWDTNIISNLDRNTSIIGDLYAVFAKQNNHFNASYANLIKELSRYDEDFMEYLTPLTKKSKGVGAIRYYVLNPEKIIGGNVSQLCNTYVTKLNNILLSVLNTSKTH
jgi:hypothetical protein